MKTLGSFIDKKTLSRRKIIDEKSVFYIFGLIIKEEFGKQGAKNIIPTLFRDKKIVIKVVGSNWASEILLQKSYILKKLNNELGAEEVFDLVVSD